MRSLIEITSKGERCDMCNAVTNRGESGSMMVNPDSVEFLCSSCSKHMWEVIDSLIRLYSKAFPYQRTIDVEFVKKGGDIK